MLEDNQLSHCHFAPGGGVVVFKHIEDSVPQQLQIFLGKAGGFPGQVGGNESFASIHSVGNNEFLTHFGVFPLSILFGGNGHSGDGYFLRKDRVQASGKTKLHWTPHLAAV